MTTGTTPAATTSTPENSERPRETRDGTPLGHYESRVAGNDFSAVESVWVDESPEPPAGSRGAVMYGGKAGGSMNTSGVVPAQGHSKVSSPELASLAAKYVDVSASDWPEQSKDVAKFLHDVRSLAASVLAQAEQRTDPNGAYKP